MQLRITFNFSSFCIHSPPHCLPWDCRYVNHHMWFYMQLGTEPGLSHSRQALSIPPAHPETSSCDSKAFLRSSTFSIKRIFSLEKRNSNLLTKLITLYVYYIIREDGMLGMLIAAGGNLIHDALLMKGEWLLSG